MRKSDLNEIRARGTPDFPLELYSIDSSHSRYIMPFHWHNDFEIVYIESGEFKMVIGETEYLASTGDAFANGFNDLSYFVKTFKRYKGITPKQYRRSFELK